MTSGFFSWKISLFSYNRLGKNADEVDAEEIIDMASKASLAEQQKLVQENIHAQINNFCTSMDDILLPDPSTADDTVNSPSEKNTTTQRSGLSLAIGRSAPLYGRPGEPNLLFVSNTNNFASIF